MPELASHIAGVPESGIRRLAEIAFAMDDVVWLVIGEPDVPVAHHIAAAATAAWEADDTNYTATGGIAPLRTAIQHKLARDNDLSVDIEQIWVTVGATQGLHQAMALLLDAGDEVLVPDPGYTTFTMNARMLQAAPVPYSLRPDAGFTPDFDELETIVSDRTRAIIVNSPSNPLGVVFEESVLRDILDFARRHDLWVISDEVYEAFTYGKRHISMAALDEDDRVFSVFSLSKTYAMTGVRVGYLVVPRGLTKVMRTVQEAAISCVATPDQVAAVAAIEGDQCHVADAAAHYAANLATARRVLDERGIRYSTPGGAFYLWVDVSHATDGDVAAWAERFLLQHRVAVAPGSAFGRSGEGWIRVSLAASEAALVTGLSLLPAP
jgi:aspartate aminotransferase